MSSTSQKHPRSPSSSSEADDLNFLGVFPGISFGSTGISRSMAQPFSHFPKFRFLLSDAANDQGGGLINNLSVDIERQESIGENRVSSFVT